MIRERSALILDLLEWLAFAPRPYAEVMEAWRTNCPRLTIWEDAVEQGLVTRAARGGSAALVSLTDAGRSALRERRRRVKDDRKVTDRRLAKAAKEGHLSARRSMDGRSWTHRS